MLNSRTHIFPSIQTEHIRSARGANFRTLPCLWLRQLCNVSTCAVHSTIAGQRRFWNKEYPRPLGLRGKPWVLAPYALMLDFFLNSLNSRNETIVTKTSTIDKEKKMQKSDYLLIFILLACSFDTIEAGRGGFIVLTGFGGE